MANQNPPPVYKIFGCELPIGNDPLWFKLAVLLIILAAIVGIVWALGHWAIPTIAINRLKSVKWLRSLKLWSP